MGKTPGPGDYRPWRVHEGTDILIRNVALFLMVTAHVARIRRRGQKVSREEIFGRLLELNELVEEDWGREGLPEEELQDIAKKVTRYWNEHFNPAWGGYNEEQRAKGTETQRQKGLATRAKVEELHGEGLSVRAIAERIGRSVRTVQRHKVALLEGLREIATRREDQGEGPEPRNRLVASTRRKPIQSLLRIGFIIFEPRLDVPLPPRAPSDRRRRRLPRRSP